MWAAPDADLAARVAATLEPRAACPPCGPSRWRCAGCPPPTPCTTAGSAEACAAVDRWAGPRPALLTLGRPGLFAHDNTHHALAMGWAAADALRPDGSWDSGAWAAARDRFRTHVVED